MSEVTYQIDGSTLVARAAGSYPPGALRDLWDAALADADWPRVRAVLVDMRSSQSLRRRSLHELRKTASWFAVELSRHALPCALLVEGAVRYGVMRMAVGWMPRGVVVQVFRDRERAVEWLGTRRRAAG